MIESQRRSLLLRPQRFREIIKIKAMKVLKALPVLCDVGAKEIARERPHELGDEVFHRADGGATWPEAERRSEIEAVYV